MVDRSTEDVDYEVFDGGYRVWVEYRYLRVWSDMKLLVVGSGE